MIVCRVAASRMFGLIDHPAGERRKGQGMRRRRDQSEQERSDDGPDASLEFDLGGRRTSSATVNVSIGLLPR